MSYEQGKKMAEAGSAFVRAVAAKNDLELFEHYAATLERNDVIPRHEINRAADLFRKLRQASHIKLLDLYDDSRNENGDRTMRLGLLTLAPCEDDYDTYLPSHLIAAVRQKMVLFAKRQYPIAFASSAIETMYRQQNDGAILDWSAHATFQTTHIGLALTHTLRNKMLVEGVTSSPVLLPDPAGLYIGYASHCLPDKFDPHIIAAAHADETGVLARYNLTPDRKPVDQPQVFITLRGFLGVDKLNAAQLQLHGDYMDILDSEQTELALCELANIYPAGVAPLKERVRDLEKLRTDLDNVVYSKLWQKVAVSSDNALRHDLH